MGGLVAFGVSLFTKPDPCYRLIRTTIQTKGSHELRPDEVKEVIGGPRFHGEEEMRKLNPSPQHDAVAAADSDLLHGRDYATGGQDGTRGGVTSKCIDCLCPGDDDISEGSEGPETGGDGQNLADLNQTTFQKTILRLNLGVILLAAIGLYTYFSINPFTIEQIDQLREAVLEQRGIE